MIRLTLEQLSIRCAHARPCDSCCTTKHFFTLSGWPPPTPPRYVLITFTAASIAIVDSGDWTMPPCALTQPTVTGASFAFAGPIFFAPTYLAKSGAHDGTAACLAVPA